MNIAKAFYNCTYKPPLLLDMRGLKEVQITPLYCSLVIDNFLVLNHGLSLLVDPTKSPIIFIYPFNIDRESDPIIYVGI